MEGTGSARRRRGAWYTPPELVDLVVSRSLDGWELDRAGVGRPGSTADRPLTVLDPACGDGRFLIAAGRALRARGIEARLVGVDISEEAIAAARAGLDADGSHPESSLVRGDALQQAWDDVTFDLVLGNPPFLSPLSSETPRRPTASGVYSDMAVEFLALALRLIAPLGRIGLILPQSVLASRDAGPVRRDVERRCRRTWSWWSRRLQFDANVVVCALGFEDRGRHDDADPHDDAGPRGGARPRGDVGRRGGAGGHDGVRVPIGAGDERDGDERNGDAETDDAEIDDVETDDSETVESEVDDRPGNDGSGNDARDAAPRWTDVVTDALGVPRLEVASLAAWGVLGDRASLSANFRDEYYGMLPAVVEGFGSGAAGPPLITSGLIDPGQSQWGIRSARYGKRTFRAPRVELSSLAPKMQEWATAKLVPKVLVANQTTVIEAVADPDGAWLPAVPTTTITPVAGAVAAGSAKNPTNPNNPRNSEVPGTPELAVLEIAAVLTSPVASVWAWHELAGTGMSARSLRIGPRVLARLPWPAGPLDDAVDALRAGELGECGRAVARAYGIGGSATHRAVPGLGESIVPTIDALMTWWLERLPSRPTTATESPTKSTS